MMENPKDSRPLYWADHDWDGATGTEDDLPVGMFWKGILGSLAIFLFAMLLLWLV